MTNTDDILLYLTGAFPEIFCVGYDPILDNYTQAWIEEHRRPYAASLIGSLALWMRTTHEPTRIEHFSRGIFYGHLIGTLHQRRADTLVRAMVASSYGIQVKSVFEFFLLEDRIFNEMLDVSPASADRLMRFRDIVREQVMEWNKKQN